jgi:hypothetical protein
MENRETDTQCGVCAAPREDEDEDDEVEDLTGTAAAAGGAAAAAASSSSTMTRTSRGPAALQDNPVFLAGLEETIGHIHVAPYLKERLALSLKRQWALLETKLRDVSGSKDFPLVDVQACQKALVFQAVQRALKLRDTMELLTNCAQHEITQLEQSHCLHCSEGGDTTELLYCSDACTHAMCKPCASRLLLDKIASRNCLTISCPSSECEHEVSARLIRASLSRAEFDEFNDMCFQLSLQDKSKYMHCPRKPPCTGLTELIKLEGSGPEGSKSLLPLPKDGIKLTDESGKILSAEAWRHYSEFRLRCPDCSNNFCALCKTMPYHLGKTCAEYEAYAASVHCRYCAEPLKAGHGPDATGLPVCDEAACQAHKQRACTHKLACGHGCFGVKGETEHPPCLEEDCPAAADSKVDGGENCAICYVEELRHGGPVVQLTSCGHVYHEACVLEKLRKRWSGTRITFGFLDCSQCKAAMQHPSPPIQALLQPILALRKEVSAKALARLTIENMTKDAKLVDPKSQFYNKPEAYAMASFAYYNCFK